MSEVPATTMPPPPPPPPPSVPAAPAAPGFDFVKPFAYVFEDPNWVQKVLLGGLFYLAGFLIIGWFFVLGYAARTARNVIRGDERPLPEWENVGDFFGEGARLVGVGLVYVIPMIVLVAWFIVPAIFMDIIDNRAAEILGSGIAGCISCLIVPLSLAMMLFLPASLLFAAVEQRFSAAFEFARIWAFIKENIGNYLLAIVVYLIARFVAGFGIVLFCIGLIFTGFWSVLIMTHGFAQAYKLAPKR
ncbi:MAG TPA: DUF4013 domain-containing protein [Thermoanaerobaculia bacterium]|nr:DUF4013 domain-containing protein [Thermoanaerobaculia bacterium]